MKQLWNEKFETMSRDELENVRNLKIQTQLKYCYEKSSFYKNAFDEIGFSPEDIKTIEDLRKLPIIMNKEIEKNSRDESIKEHGHPYGMHLCVPIEQLLVAKTTGGTTGAPTFTYTFTKNDIDRWNEQFARVFWFGGLRPEDIVLYCLTLSGGWAGSQIKSAIEHIGALTIEAGAEGGSERIFYLANLTKPNVLLATPSLTEYLIEKSRKITGKLIKEYNFEKIFSTGEPGVGLEEVREKVENAYGAKWFDYLMPCGEGACCSCDSKEYQGMHEVAPEYSIFLDDLVDPKTKQPVEINNGAIGEIVLTSLDREGVPLIKFALGDIVQVFTERCSCGYPGPGYRMKYIGRADDLLIVKGVNIYPGAIKDVISSFEPKVTGHMRVILTEKPPRVTPPLKLKIEYTTDNNLEKLKEDIIEKCHQILKIRPEVELVPPDTIDRTSGKTKLIEKRY